MNRTLDPLDHRAVQRALFRMQMDAEFASGLLAGREESVATADLGPAELELVRGLDPAGISADPGSKRRLQVLGNVASEFTGTLALTAVLERDPLGTFPTSSFFHSAVRRNESLPRAFARHLAEQELPDPAAAVLELETAMVDVRRLDPALSAAADPGQVVLSPSVRLLELPAGTLDLADQLGRDTAAGREPKGLPALDRSVQETVLLQARAPGGAERWLSLGGRGLSEIHAERLEEPVADLLRALEQPADRTRLEGLAARLGATMEELLSFLDSLGSDGVLTGGTSG